MAKSIRSKKEKRLRTIRREIVTPHYELKDVAKLAAQAAALEAPKLPVKPTATSSMEIVPETAGPNPSMEMETDDGSQKDLIGVAKTSKRQFKVGKRKRYGKGKGKGRVKRRHI